MPKDDRIYEKLLQHDKQFKEHGEILSRSEVKLLRMEIILRKHSDKFEEHDKRFDAIDKRFTSIDKQLGGIDGQLLELTDELQNFRGAVINALDHLVVAADRVDKERLVATYRIDTLDERVNKHDKEIAKLKVAK